MNNWQYGSGYGPSYRERPESHVVHKKKNTKLRKAGIIAAGIAGAIFLLLWLFLGEFRFLIYRFPSLTGFPFSSRTYLVLFQNNYELRPTGGFISTYGELTFSNGIYTGIEFHDVYGDIDDHPYVEPPLILKTMLENEDYQGHTFRDSNVDPDLTIAKDEIIEFYNKSNPEVRVDGIIAADFTFLENLVEMYEPLKVEEYELTKQNLFETLSTIVSDIDRHNEEALANRKNISGVIVKKIITKSIIFPWRVKALMNEALQGFDEKHLLAAFEKKGLAKSFAKRNWDGALPDSEFGDFIAVNDANYGGMKTNRYLLRDVTYEITVTPEKDLLGNPVVNGKLTLTLSNQGIWNVPLSGPYSSYLRTLIPLGSNISKKGSFSEDRDNAEVIGEIVELNVGDEISFSYEYELPEYVWDEGTYYLHMHKQPGTLADHYRVIVKLPQGLTMESDNFDVRENIGFYDTYLLTDQNLSFSILPDTNSPRIVMHEITAPNEITIMFNEPVSQSVSGLNFDISDLNFADEVTDEIIITGVRVDGAAVILTTAGMGSTVKERYEIEMHDIKDQTGNSITPNPRSVTVVIDDDSFEVPAEEVETTVEEELTTEENE